MKVTRTKRPNTIGSPAAPLCLPAQRGVSLVELLIYSVVLSVIVLAVYQSNSLLTKSFNQSINASLAIFDSTDAITALRKEAQLSNVPIKIVDQSQGSGAPAGTGTANCIEMQKYVLGVQTTYSISVRWDSASGLFQLINYKTSGCSSTPATTNTVVLSNPIFQKQDAVNFFTGIGSVSNNGYREVNFNFKTSSGSGTLASGLSNSTVQLSSNSPTLHECRVASPDRSWFTNFSGKKIRSVTVSFTQNFESSYDRLSYTGTYPGVVVTSINGIGTLHLHAKDGLSVSDWISALANVTYTRTSTAPAVTESLPPKRITYVLGDGLTFSPSGLPSAHFYLAIKLNTAKNFTDADNAAKSFCYPAFNDDSNYLAQGAKPSATSSSCGNTGSILRLTGHLATLSTQGEHSFIKNNVLQMVYPESAPYVTGGYSGPFSTTTSDMTPTAGKSWLGGEFSSSNYNWTRGFEAPVYSFANNQLAAQNQPGAAGLYFVSLKSALSGTSPGSASNIYKLFYQIEGSDSSGNYWSVQDPSTTASMSYLIVEFGDNKGADGTTTAETDLNAQIRLKKDVTLVPLDFFNSCTY